MLATDLAGRWPLVAAGLGAGGVNLDQAGVIVRALNLIVDGELSLEVADRNPELRPGIALMRAAEAHLGPAGAARVLGEALCAFLEAADPARMPIHGGNATKVIVTIAWADLVAGTGVAVLGDGTRISVGEARRLLCNAGVLPAVLGTDSQVLDMGLESRLYDGRQRTALGIAHPVCRAEHCTVPATWCEAHHKKPWSQGGRTDLKDGVLLCPWHHHRAHDPGYTHEYLLNGDVRYHRRR